MAGVKLSIFHRRLSFGYCGRERLNSDGTDGVRSSNDRSNEALLKELMVSTLAMTDALAKLMTGKGIITDEEFKTQLSVERANYLAVLKRSQ